MTQKPPALTDLPTLARHRARADHLDGMFLQEIAAAEIQDRLAMVNRTFSSPVIVTGFPEFWQRHFPSAKIVADDEMLDLIPCHHDLIVHAMSLHWANDPVGQVIQCKRALQPDGLFLACLFGGQTLHELRFSLAQAEARLSGGLSPRVAPMAEIRDLGALLQRADLRLPVADSLTQSVTYRNILHLAQDLRAMGETNALSARRKVPASRSLFDLAQSIYAQQFQTDDHRLRATYELIFLSGWAPHPDQQKPLKPGSASHSLAETLERLKSNNQD